MSAPLLEAVYESSWSAINASKSTSVTVEPGDRLVVVAGMENGAPTFNAPTGGGLIFTSEQVVDENSQWCSAHAWTATATTAQTFTLSVTINGGNYMWGFAVFRFSGSDGIGGSAADNTTGAPALDVLTTGDNSALVVINVDWNASDGSSRSWRTINGAAAVEDTYFRDSSRYTVYLGHHADSGAAGTKTVGLTSPSSQKFTIIGVEVLGTASASPPASGSGSGLLDLTGSGSGSAPVVPVRSGSGSGALALTGSGSGTAPLVPTTSGSGSGSLALTGSGAASAVHEGSGFGNVQISGSGSATAPHEGAGDGSVQVSGSGSGSTAHAGAGAGLLGATGSGAGHAPSVGISAGSGSGLLRLTGSGAGSAPTVTRHAGSGTGLLRLTATGTGHASRSGSGSGLLRVTGSGIGRNSDQRRDLRLIEVGAPTTALTTTSPARPLLGETPPTTALTSAPPATPWSTTEPSL